MRHRKLRHSEVAQAFADGAEKEKGSRMFIDGNTVYSHGTHYPIARRYFKDGVDYLFNTPYGSHSTEAHRGYVRGALSGSNILVVDGCHIDNAAIQYHNNEEAIEEAKEKLKRARLHKNDWKDRIRELEAQNEMLGFIAAKNRLLAVTERDKNER